MVISNVRSKTIEKEQSRFSIGNISEIVAILVATGFVVSVIYDWGFLYALGLNFTFLPTTITDHFHTGILWFPYLLALVLAYFAIEFQFQRFEKGLTEEEIVNSSENLDKMKRFRNGPYRLMEWIAILSVINFILMGDVFSTGLPVMLAIIWMMFSEWTYNSPLIQMRRSLEVHLAFTFLPIVFIIAFFSGYNTAVNAATKRPSYVDITFDNSKNSDKVAVLRSIEKGYLVLDKNNQIAFISWDKIHTIKHEKLYTPYKGISCEWFNYCFGEDNTSNK